MDDAETGAGAYRGRVHPEEYQPPLTWRSHAWRLVLMLLISGVAWAPRFTYQWQTMRWWFFADAAVGVICFVAVIWRRRYPVTVAVVTNLAGVLSAASAGPAALALVSLATRRRWREIIPVGVFSVVCGLLAEGVFRPSVVPRLTFFDGVAIVAMMGLLVAWGMYLGSRRELLASWQSRAELAESQQAAKVAQARIAERGRIAREMHDVLAHRISTVKMYSGALVYREDLTAEEMRENASVIEATSQRALTELREVLGVLRDGPGDAEPERPQSGAVDVDALVAENRDTGMRIHYTCAADLSAIPEAVGRTLFRCVQEALTNARKHSPASVVDLRISGEPGDGVSLEAINAIPLAGVAPSDVGAGFGLVGLAERVALSGGTQSCRVTSDHRFVLRVSLPWQA